MDIGKLTDGRTEEGRKDAEERESRVALHSPTHSCPLLSPFLPPLAQPKLGKGGKGASAKNEGTFDFSCYFSH